MTTLEQTVQRLADVEAIRTLKLRYAEACDTGFDPDRLNALFTDDGVFDVGEHGAFRGPRELGEHWVAVSRLHAWAVHLVTNHVVEVEPGAEEASGTCLTLGLNTTTGGVAQWSALRYRERYRKVDGEWRFAEMKVAVEMLTDVDKSWATAATAGGS